MGADKKKIASLMGEIFGGNDGIAKAEVTMEEAGRITQAILCKAINPDTEDEMAMDVVKRGRAFVTAIAGQEGVAKKADDSDEEITVYSVEKALVEEVMKDIEGVEPSGSWGSNMDALKKKFDASEDDNSSSNDEGDGQDGNGDADGDRDDTNKNAGNNEDGVWNRVYDLNTKLVEDEDWGKDPDFD
jgi:hypothetical protein